MSWAKIDDAAAFAPKVLQAGNAAFGAWVRMLAWCSQQLTDGRVPAELVRAVAEDAATVDRLVSAGLLDRAGEDYQIHDYLDYNPNRETVLARRADIGAKRRAAGRQGAETRWQAHGKADGKRPGDLPQPSDSPDPTRPDPTRPVPISRPIPDPGAPRGVGLEGSNGSAHQPSGCGSCVGGGEWAGWRPDTKRVCGCALGAWRKRERKAGRLQRGAPQADEQARLAALIDETARKLGGGA